MRNTVCVQETNTADDHHCKKAVVEMLVLLLMICQLLLSTLLLILVLRYPFSSSSICLNSDDHTICRHSHFEPLFCHSILAWMSEVEVTMRRGNRLEISLARVEKMLNDNQDTVAALQEAITKVEVMMARNRNTSNSNDNITSNEEEDRAMERRWWRRKEE